MENYHLMVKLILPKKINFPDRIYSPTNLRLMYADLCRFFIQRERDGGSH